MILENMLLSLLVFLGTFTPGKSGFIFVGYPRHEMGTVTSEYCDEIGDEVIKFDRSALQIEDVHPDALRKCTSVEIIVLSHNKIEILDSDIFKTNVKTRMLYLEVNLIKFLPNNIFKPLKNLLHLDLSKNPIATIEPVLQSNLNQLLELIIIQIGLRELDVDEIQQKLPSLNEIRFNHNLLKCEIYNRIKLEFERKSVTVSEYHFAGSTGDKCLKISLDKNEIEVLKMHDLKISQNKIDAAKDQYLEIKIRMEELVENLEKLNQNEITDLETKIIYLKTELIQLKEKSTSVAAIQFEHSTTFLYVVGALICLIIYSSLVSTAVFFVLIRASKYNKNYAIISKETEEDSIHVYNQLEFK